MIKELFICEGYKAQVLAKTTFEYGDADVLAIKADRFSETKILIQVKHHDGNTNEWGLHQLSQIRLNASYKDYLFILITSGSLNEHVKTIADNFNIITMDGEELADWLFEKANYLSIETRMKLGISTVPQMIN